MHLVRHNKVTVYVVVKQTSKQQHNKLLTGGERMNVDEFVAELKASMDCGDTNVFGLFTVPTAIVITWLIMFVIMVLTLVFVRNLKVQPTSKVI